MEDPAKEATGQLGQYAYSSRAETQAGLPRDRSMADVLKDIIGNVQEIVRSEARLAKAEVKEEGLKAWQAGQMLMAGAVVGLYAVAFILLGIVYALALVVAAWLAALIIGFTLLVLTGILISVGRARWREVHPKPEKTIKTVKENVQWMKDQTRS
jgi:uncharacterized membrane protein YqjE